MVDKYKVLFIICFLFSSTVIVNADCDDFHEGLELFNKKFYVLAQSFFDNYINCGESIFLLEEAHYYSAVCSKELYNYDAEIKFQNYLESYPKGRFVNDVYFNMGSIFFEAKKFTSSYDWYNKVSHADLVTTNKDIYFFRHGYTSFKDSLYDQSLFLFEQIKKNSFYFNLGVYFTSHIYFSQEKYNLALRGFEKLDLIKGLSEISAYYKVSIYYKQKKYNQVIEYGQRKISDGAIKKKEHVSNLIAESYYNLGMYNECVNNFSQDPSLLKSHKKMYKFGYSLYKLDSIDYAIKIFEKIDIKNDSLGQYISYYLGNCYLKNHNKRYALNSFNKAKDYNHDIFLKEDAYYKYIVLCFDLNWEFDDLYDDIIKYQALFPDSEHSSVVDNLLLNYFTFTKDYEKALSILKNKTFLNIEEKSAYQRMSFFLAKRYLQEYNLQKAKTYFVNSLKYDINKEYAAFARYFLGDINYNLKDYKSSISYYKAFLFSSSSYGVHEYEIAKYSLAHSYFKIKKYQLAANWFRKFISNYKQKDKFLNDAYLRLADTYFMLEDYNRANKFYFEAVKINIFDVDYAMFQQIKCYELLSDFNYQKETIENFLSIYNVRENNSIYLDDVIYNYAIINLLDNNIDKAIVYFDKIINSFSESNFIRESFLQKGLIYSNLYFSLEEKDEYFDKSKENFIYIIENYTYTKEYTEALLGLKLLYTSSGKHKEYFDYLKSKDIDIKMSSQDSIVFSSVESLYLKKDYNKAILGFNEYITDYPDGKFYLFALYYRAKSYLETDQIIFALNDFLEVVDLKSQYYNKSLLFSADISFQLKDYASALFHYTKLYKIATDNHIRKHVLLNIIRCQNELNLYIDLISYCEDFLDFQNLSYNDIHEVKFILGNAYFSLSDFKKSKEIYTWFLDEGKGNDHILSESKYIIAYMLFLNDSLDTSEDLIMEILDHSYDNYYIAKSLILLSDILLEKQNYFQAKATLNSIIENYNGDTIVNEAKMKLNDIIEFEKQSISNDTLSEEEIILDLLKDFKIYNNDLIELE